MTCHVGRFGERWANLKDTYPRHSNRGFRISGGCILSLVLSGVFAQSPTPTPTPAPSPEVFAETESVIVTGSVVPTQTAAEVGPNPVQVIDRETIEKSGERNTEELLRNQPVANANGVRVR